MARPNTTDPAVQVRYSSVAILLHWLLALGLAFQLALGWAMPDGANGFDEYQLHKSVGITILILTLVRLAWRLGHRPPPPVEGGLGGFLAKAVHTGFYVVLLLGPLTGWAIVSTSRIEVPTLVYGVLPWPHLPLAKGINEVAEEAHELLALVAVGLFLLHVAGALRHHFLIKDGLLRRMGPGGSAVLAGVLALLVVATYFATGMRVASNAMATGGYEPDAQRSANSVARVDRDAARAAEERAEEKQEAAEETAEEAAKEAEEAKEEAEDSGPLVWAIQPGGRLGFSVGGSQGAVRGSFSDWSGAITFDPENPETADLRITIRLASASLGDATQDEMLQGPDFFGSSANPTATWRSTSVRRTSGNRYSANGTLSLRGASRPQALTFNLSGEGARRRVEGSARIDRSAFGVGSGEAAAGLDSAVTVSFSFDAVGREP